MGTQQSTYSYNLQTRAWTNAGALQTARFFHSATTLHDGRAFIAGGATDKGTTSIVEVYDPTTGLFTYKGGMTTPIVSDRTWRAFTVR